MSIGIKSTGLDSLLVNVRRDVVFGEQKNPAPSTVNVRLAAVRRLAYEASEYRPSEP
jgi:hypothetical protein